MLHILVLTGVAYFLGVAESTIQWVTYERMKAFFAEQRQKQDNEKSGKILCVIAKPGPTIL